MEHNIENVSKLLSSIINDMTNYAIAKDAMFPGTSESLYAQIDAFIFCKKILEDKQQFMELCEKHGLKEANK